MPRFWIPSAEAGSSCVALTERTVASGRWGQPTAGKGFPQPQAGNRVPQPQAGNRVRQPFAVGLRSPRSW
jgi:hypothetical protein